MSKLTDKQILTRLYIKRAGMEDRISKLQYDYLKLCDQIRQQEKLAR